MKPALETQKKSSQPTVLTLRGGAFYSAALFTALVGYPFSGPAVAAEKPAVKVENTDTFVPLGILLDRVPTKQDLNTYRILRNSIRNASKQSGAWNLVRNRQIRYLSPQEALGEALYKNLTLSRSRQNTAKAKEAVEQASAVFDPTFNLSFGNKVSHRYDRKIMGRVVYPKRNEVVVEHDPGALLTGEGQVKLYKEDLAGPHENEIVFGARPAADVRESITVSKKKLGKNENSPSTTGTGSISISQLLPWGPSISLTSVTTRKRTFDDVMGMNWKAPWGTSWSASLYIPLPFTKNFGPYATADVAVKKAKIAKNSQDWLLQADINNILTQVDLSYWNLVQSLQQLRVTIQNQWATSKQYRNAKRLFGLKRMTRLGMEQMEAERARTRVQVEMQWNAVINASHALAVLTEGEQDRVGQFLLLPAGFQDRLKRFLPVDQAQAINIGLERNPLLMVNDFAVQTSELEYNYRRNQTRPDLAASVSYSEKQDNSIYGYNQLEKSLSHIHNPDSRSNSASVNYNYPVRKRYVRAGRDLAEAAKNISELNRQSVVDTISKGVSDALSDLYSSKKRLEMARSSQRLAGAALKKAQGQLEIGNIKELELILKRRDLLNAHLSAVSAAVDVKKAETALLSAQGILPEALPGTTATNEFDRYRIQKLVNNNTVPYFSAITKRLRSAF